MTLLVTGASGFIGRYMVERLQREGIPFCAAVRTPRPGIAGASLAVVGEIDGGTRWEAALEGIDTVVHIAGRAHAFGADTRGDFHRVNVEGTESLVRALAAAGGRRMVLLSTAKVHGEGSAGGPITERDAPAPADPYARSKLAAEDRVWAVAAETGIEAVVVRTVLVYGAGVKANFHSLLRAVDRGLPLPLGSVRNARSLIYAGNLADALLACATRAEAAGETFLVSDGPAISTADLVRAIAHALGVRPRLLPVPPALIALGARAARRPEVAARLLGSFEVDTGRIRSRLGWRPPVGLEQALAETAAWYRASVATR